MEIYHI